MITAGCDRAGHRANILNARFKDIGLGLEEPVLRGRLRRTALAVVAMEVVLEQAAEWRFAAQG